MTDFRFFNAQEASGSALRRPASRSEIAVSSATDGQSAPGLIRGLFGLCSAFVRPSYMLGSTVVEGSLDQVLPRQKQPWSRPELPTRAAHDRYLGVDGVGWGRRTAAFQNFCAHFVHACRVFGRNTGGEYEFHARRLGILFRDWEHAHHCPMR